MKKAKRLCEGDTIGIVSPASPSENKSEVTRGIETVSYTHLDVYKRQELGLVALIVGIVLTFGVPVILPILCSVMA